MPHNVAFRGAEFSVVRNFVPDDPSGDPRPPDPRRGALIGFLVVAVLVIAGLYLVHVLGAVSRLQDCVMQGRSNCAPVEREPPR